MSEEKKNEILENKLDTDELEAVSGGSLPLHNTKRKDAPAVASPKVQGGCTANYFRESCKATVEANSWCGTNDSCVKFSEVYNRIPKSEQSIVADDAFVDEGIVTDDVY